MAKKMNKRGKIEIHRITPGVTIDNIARNIEVRNSSVAGIIRDDTKNRTYVINKILDNMSNGMTEDDSLELIMQDKIVEQFKYLENNGCNIKNCFRNWARGYKNRKEKQKEK